MSVKTKAEIALGRGVVAGIINTGLDSFAQGRLAGENLAGAVQVAGSVAAADFLSREFILPGHKSSGASRTVTQAIVEPALTAGIMMGTEYVRGNGVNIPAGVQAGVIDFAAGAIAPAFGVGVGGGSIDDSILPFI